MVGLPSAATFDLRECTPDRQQTFLLHAAMSSGNRALEAWQLWRDQVDLDAIDPASFRLLPLAYRNMANLGLDDALVRRLKGVYRHSWYKNQIQNKKAQGVLADLTQAGIPVMLLKGAALSARFYRDDGIRFMNDVDLMVADTEYERAATIMLGSGWQSVPYSSDAMFWYHRHQFKHGCALKKGNVEVDLHSQLLRFIPQNNEGVWARSLQGKWQGFTVHFLSDTDQLFHTCVHGLLWSHAFLSWIPDALLILRSAQCDIDWQSLLETAEKTRTISFLYNALAYLRSEFQAPVPDEFMAALAELPVSWAERREYQMLGERQTKDVGYRFRRALYQSSRYRSAIRADQQAITLSLLAWMKFLFIHLYPAGMKRSVSQFFGRLKS